MKNFKKIMALGLVAVMSLGLVACGGSSDSGSSSGSSGGATAEGTTAGGEMDFSGRTLTFGCWAGSSAEACKKAYVDPFNELTGANIVIEEFGDDVTARVIAQAQNNTTGFDMIQGCGVQDQIAMMAQNGGLEKLDYSLLPNSEKIADTAKFEYAIGQYIISTLLAWNTDVYGDNPPDTCKKYYDIENYPGNRGHIGYSPTGQLEQALRAQGVSYDDMYPLDVEKAYKALDPVKPSITKWWNSGAEIRQALADGEVDCGSFWGGAVIEAILSDGVDNIAISHDGASLIVDCFGITSTCQDKELAYAFLNYCLSAEPSAVFSSMKYHAPVNPEAFDYLPEEMLPYLTTYGGNDKDAFWVDIDYWTDNYEKLSEDYILWGSK